MALLHDFLHLSFFVNGAPENAHTHEESVETSYSKTSGWNSIPSCGGVLTTEQSSRPKYILSNPKNYL